VQQQQQQQQTTPVFGKRSRHFLSSSTPIAGLAECHDDHQVRACRLWQPGCAAATPASTSLNWACGVQHATAADATPHHRTAQADTPDSGRPAPMVPGTTERLLAGFTLSTPVAGLRLQVRVACWAEQHPEHLEQSSSVTAGAAPAAAYTAILWC
jgi:hypothetical protein